MALLGGAQRRPHSGPVLQAPVRTLEFAAPDPLTQSQLPDRSEDDVERMAGGCEDQLLRSHQLYRRTHLRCGFCSFHSSILLFRASESLISADLI